MLVESLLLLIVDEIDQHEVQRVQRVQSSRETLGVVVRGEFLDLTFKFVSTGLDDTSSLSLSPRVCITVDGQNGDERQ